MAKRYGIAEGTRLPEPIFEFFYKSDALHDPLVNDDHIRVLGWANVGEIAQMKALTHRVNQVLKPLFADSGIELVDYKLEFDHALPDPTGPLLLGDEFTPDGCRPGSCDARDKDRFAMIWAASSRRRSRIDRVPLILPAVCRATSLNEKAGLVAGSCSTAVDCDSLILPSLRCPWRP
jgi:phosphoribosylaminoimidazole-succinocarboxamide synthase